MKLTGKEKVSLYTEKDGKRNFTISQLNLNQLLNTFILDRMCQQLIKNKNNERLTTGYLTINDMKISKGTKVSVKFRASLKKHIPIFKNTKYIATLEIIATPFNFFNLAKLIFFTADKSIFFALLSLFAI